MPYLINPTHASGLNSGELGVHESVAVAHDPQAIVAFQIADVGGARAYCFAMREFYLRDMLFAWIDPQSRNRSANIVGT